MSGARPKPAIPAWQRAALPPSPATEDPVSGQPEASQGGLPADKTSTANEETDGPEEPASVPSDDTSPTTALATRDAEATSPSFNADDFHSFKEQQSSVTQRPSVPQAVHQQQPSAPPIITYPEFLVDAHKPPPFITPTRIINALYGAGGITTLLYGVSKWVINPMMDDLSEARHDYLSHSQSKVDEFNERLSKLVSKVPEGRKDTLAQEVDMEDVRSETSDPTELYHRDMGTQTSPLPSRRPSLPDVSVPPKKDPVVYQTGGLETLRDRINEVADATHKTTESNKDNQEIVNKLRHYLDGLIYGNPGVVWQSSEDAMTMKPDVVQKDDPIEDLKKEIRGVKGVLLSAKRFPAVNRHVAGAA